jgi:hypothetical protein
MQRMRMTSRALIVLMGIALPVQAFVPDPLPPVVDEAVALGQSFTERDRLAFHARYRALVARAPVDYIDIVTPFRRVVIAAEVQARQGSRRFGQREGLAVLDAAAGHVSVVAELTFHPQNTYVGVPGYDVILTRGEETRAALSIDRQPRFGARVDTLPAIGPRPGGLTGTRSSQPMLGGTVTAEFDGRALEPNGTYSVVLREGNATVATVRFDLSQLR